MALRFLAIVAAVLCASPGWAQQGGQFNDQGGPVGGQNPSGGGPMGAPGGGAPMGSPGGGAPMGSPFPGAPAGNFPTPAAPIEQPAGPGYAPPAETRPPSRSPKRRPKKKAKKKPAAVKPLPVDAEAEANKAAKPKAEALPVIPLSPITPWNP